MPALPGLAIDARLKAELTGLLTDELSLCESLLACMREEQDCLTHYDHAGFARCDERKNSVVASLRELDGRRKTLFRQLQGANLDTASLTFEHWQESHAHDPAFSAIVRKLRQVATACSRENQKLGRLINVQTRFFDFMLKQLMPGRTDSLTYLRSGGTQTTGSVRALASV